MTDVVIVLTTVGSGEEGERLARQLVEEHLAACVNLLAPMTSFYHWKDKLERDEERQLVIKTTKQALPALEARVAQLHTYELPEFLVLSADAGAAYFTWVNSHTTADRRL